MLVVLCYDVSDDERRTRLYKRLLGYGTPVQRSVFECDLRPAELDRLRRVVRRIADPEKDDVRIYVLCEQCAQKVHAVAGSRREAPPDFLIV
ncbi:MAG: CRISPR-associated endonuclease Cas2 [Thermomicrobium sp.]|nr:CRISPR-associated endonuclease Cas2 [Thermomicrobium sp.]